MSLLKKQKRKELLGTEDGKLVDDTDDERVLANRWVDALKPPTLLEDTSEPGNITNNTGRSVAIWFPMHRVAVVIVSRGKMMGSVGVIGDGELCLLPEEALYLAEKRYLTLYQGGSDTVLKSYTDAKLLIPLKGSDTATKQDIKLKCLSTNIQELYSILTESAGVSLACYLTYRTLRDHLNCIVRRECRNLGNFVDESNNIAVEHIERGISYHVNRIHILKPIPDLPHYRSGMDFDESIVAFETFTWTSSFSKNRCGNPETRVVVVRAQDQMPDIMALYRLASHGSLSSSSSSSSSSTSLATVPSVIFGTKEVCAPYPHLQVSMIDEEGAVSISSFKTGPIQARVKKKKQKRPPPVFPASQTSSLRADMICS